MNKKLLAVLMAAVFLIGSAAFVVAVVGNKPYPKAIGSETRTDELRDEKGLEARTRWTLPLEQNGMDRWVKESYADEIPPRMDKSPQPDTLQYDSYVTGGYLYFDGAVWGDVRFTVYPDSFELAAAYLFLRNTATGITTCTVYVCPDTLGVGPYAGCHLPDVGNAYDTVVISVPTTTTSWNQVDFTPRMFYQNDDFHITAGISAGGTGWMLTVDSEGSDVLRSMLADPDLADTSWWCPMPYDLIIRAGGELHGVFNDLAVTAIYDTADMFFPDTGASVLFRADVENVGLQTVNAGDYDVTFAIKDTAGTVTPLGVATGVENIGPGETKTLSATSPWIASPEGEYVAYAYLSYSDPADGNADNDSAAMSQQPFAGTWHTYTNQWAHSYGSIHYVDGAQVAMRYITHCDAVTVDSIGFGTSFAISDSEWVHLYLWETDKYDTTVMTLLWEDSAWLWCNTDTLYYFTVPVGVKVNAPAYAVGIGAYDIIEGPDSQYVEPYKETAPLTSCPDGPQDASNPRMHFVAVDRFLGSNWNTNGQDWVVDGYASCAPLANLEAAPTRIDFPTNADWLRPDSSRTVMATVTNNGALTASFNVTADDDQLWAGSATVTNLAPGADTTVSFTPNWTPDTVVTDYRFTIVTHLAGDEFPGNDTLVGTIIRSTYPDSCYLWLDDGSDTLVWIGGSVWYLSAEVWWGNEFMASECSFDSAIISHVSIYTGTYLTSDPADSGFPDNYVDPFEISIWLEQGGATTMVSMDTVIGDMDSSGFVYWIPNPPPKVLHDDHFWVLMSNVVDSRGNESITYDTILDHPTRQWGYTDALGWWNPVDNGDTFPDWNIRAWLDPIVESGYACGDCNGDGRVTVADATYLVNYIYRGGAAPLGRGDVNMDGRTTVADATYIVNYIYRGGAPPCNPPLGYAPNTDEEATVAFSSARTENGTIEIPVRAQFGVPLAGSHLKVTYDHTVLEPLMPELTSRTEGLDLFCEPSLVAGELTMGMLSLSGSEMIQPGSGSVAVLRFKKLTDDADLSSVEITEAILVDEESRALKTTVLGYSFGPGLPKVFSLSQNYPNPLVSGTDIRYALPKDVKVTVEVFNLLGEKVQTLVNRRETAGQKVVHWDGTTTSGDMVAPGIYFYRIAAGEFTATKKMIVVR